MADVAFDLLGDASIHSTPSRDTNNNLLTHNGTGTVLKEEEDAFSAAVSVWRGIFFKAPDDIYPRNELETGWNRLRLKAT